jgi:hypothetical protein
LRECVEVSLHVYIIHTWCKNTVETRYKEEKFIFELKEGFSGKDKLEVPLWIPEVPVSPDMSYFSIGQVPFSALGCRNYLADKSGA